MDNTNEFKSFYKRVGGNEGSLCQYNTRLDTYGCGCEHDCKYCYAKSLLSFRGLWDAESPRVADVEKVKRKVSKLEKGSFVRMGGMTDCFAPIEKENRVSLETMTALNEQGVNYLIVTKSPLIATGEYIETMSKELAHIQVSITTTSNETAATYESTASVTSRIEAVETLSDAGFDVSLRLSPYMREYVDPDVINNVRVEKCLVEFLRVSPWIKKWFDVDYTDYTVKSGGYLHLPLDKKLAALKLITLPQVSVCEDVPEHHLYFERHFNPNPDDCCNLRRD